MKLGCVCDEQDVAVNVNGGSDRPEEEGEDVTGLVWGNEDGCSEVLHLKQKQKMSYFIICIYTYKTSQDDLC